MTDRPTSKSPQNPASLSQSDRRSSERIDARIHVQFRSGQEFVDSFTSNISRGGIYLETPTLPDPNALIELALTLPDDMAAKERLSKIRIIGRVVRLSSQSEGGRQPHRVAIQFLDLDPPTQALLNQIYDEVSKKA